MEMILPAFVQFEDWHISERDKKYKITIDVEKMMIIVRTHLTKAEKVNLKTYEFDNSSLLKISDIISYESITKFLNTSESALSEFGYRDGWYVNYKICFRDRQVFTGSLGTLYSESPFEKTLKWLRAEFPYIKELNNF